MIQNHVDLLSGKVHAVSTRLMATATDDCNGPSESGRHGRTEETHKHYNGVCLSDYLACASRYAASRISLEARSCQ